mmetsp:Transcript_31469/g.99796  ORF Transcript_31469/g.99796 Transcript_31469/m.99796 type:complete len:368 (-) Transcript_31469:73-1176(-)
MADAEAAPAPAPKLSAFKKKKGKNRGNKRKREADSAPAAAAGAGPPEEEATVVVRDGVAGGAGAQRRSVNSFGAFSAKEKATNDEFTFASEGLTEGVNHRDLATRTIEIDTATDRDARAIAERNLKLNAAGETNDETKIYKGQAGYRNYIDKTEDQIRASKFTGTQGPLRATTQVRVMCRFDFQPDICKDYKETGYCGFGDTCKFMHDRSDYKGGWQLEKEWEEKEKARKEREAEAQMLGIDVAELEARERRKKEDESEDMPFACHICREKFTLDKDPVQTLCNHYFCQKCAFDRSKTDPTCAICSKATGGVFNIARKLIARIRERILRDAEEAAGGEGGAAPPAAEAPVPAPAAPKRARGSWATIR